MMCPRAVFNWYTALQSVLFTDRNVRCRCIFDEAAAAGYRFEAFVRIITVYRGHFSFISAEADRFGLKKQRILVTRHGYLRAVA